MHPDLEALLAVQRHDEAIRDIERQKDSLAPRLASLNNARKRVEDEIARTETTLAKETERHRALESRIAEHRSRHEKNVEILNHAHRLKEATAAAAQVETARRVLAEEESELLALNRRIIDLRSALAASKESLVDLETTQQPERSALEGEAASIDGTIREAMVVRNEAAHAGRVRTAEFFVRQLRHRHFDAAPPRNAGEPPDRSVRTMRRPAVSRAEASRSNCTYRVIAAILP